MRKRAFFLLCVLFAGFLLVFGRSVQLQLKPHSKLVEFTENKKSWVERRAEEKLLESRGAILDRHAKPLAISLISESFFANPRQIENPKSVSYKLARYLGMERDKVLSLLTQDRYFVWLKREVDEETAKKIRELEIRGIHSSKESKRSYPHAPLAQQVIGFSGRDGKGLEGVEKSYDSWLRIKDEAKDTSVRDALGRFLRFKDFDRQWFEGNDVVLTLDLQLQRILESEMKAVVANKKAKRGLAVMLEPETGEVLAMATINAESSARDFRNRVISDIYEPGSTMKIFTAIAAMARLHMSPESQIFAEEGLLQVGPNRVREYNRKKFGWLSLEEVIAKSSNVAAAKLALKLDSQNLYTWIKRSGFGVETDIDLPGEEAGILREASSWRSIDLANIGFGQGLAVNLLQMARAYAAIANGGYLVQPHIVKEIRRSLDSQLAWRFSAHRKEVFDPRLVRQAKEMLVAATQEDGTGVAAQVANFEVAGKTGTTQKLVEVENSRGSKYKTYSSEKVIASFAGFVPAYDPKFVLVVAYDEPEAPASGGSVAAPSFARIATKALAVLGAEAQPKFEPGAQNDQGQLFVGKHFREVLKEVQRWEKEKQSQLKLYGYGVAVREELQGEELKVYFEPVKSTTK